MLEETRLRPDHATNQRLRDLGLEPLRQPTDLKQLLRRPEVDLDRLGPLGVPLETFDRAVREEVEIQVKYESYIRREMEEVERFSRFENVPIPSGFDFRALQGLSREVQEKLDRVRRTNLGQASRISGVTPAAMSCLLVHLKKIGAL